MRVTLKRDYLNKMIELNNHFLDYELNETTILKAESSSNNNELLVTVDDETYHRILVNKECVNILPETKITDQKLRCRNFPTFLLEGLMKTAAAGENKYGTYDFLKKDYTVNDHLDALKRHLMRFENPNESDLDEDTNELHLYNIAWRALVAAYVMKTKPHLDDRFKDEKA